MFCTRCGQQVPSQARYCMYCGQRTPVGIDAQCAPRRLYRLRWDKQIAGVCSGFARYLDIDVSLIRILVVALSIATGIIPGIAGYIFAWIILPVDEGVVRSAPAPQPTPQSV